MANKWLYTKPKDTSYTDMCIWVDNNFYTPDCNKSKAYEYIWLICNMLLCKKRYFNNFNDYQDCSTYIANCVMERMSRDHIKSVLNYAKSILYFRKCAYSQETYSEVIDIAKPYHSKFNNDLFREHWKSGIESNNRASLTLHTTNVLDSIPETISENIPAVYKANKLIYRNLYLSCLLSMIESVTIPAENEKIASEKSAANPAFDEVRYYNKHLGTNIILWHLPESFKEVVKVTINKSKLSLLDSLKDAIGSNIADDTMTDSVMSEAFYGAYKHD